MSLMYSVIFPAYNEASSIERAICETELVFEALQEPFEVIVVDDGSRDETVAIVQRMMRIFGNIQLVKQEKNRGKGMAVKRGVAVARGAYILFLDCDLATHPSEVRAFIPDIQNRSADIVIGSRRAKGTNIVLAQPWYRVAFGRLFNISIRWYLNIPYKDTQCGFKLFTREAAQAVFTDLVTSGWAFDVEILVRARRAGLRIMEKPVTWCNGRESRVRLADAWKIMSELHRIKRL